MCALFLGGIGGQSLDRPPENLESRRDERPHELRRSEEGRIRRVDAHLYRLQAKPVKTVLSRFYIILYGNDGIDDFLYTLYATL